MVLGAANNTTVHYLVLTLNRSSTRRSWVQETRLSIPSLEVVRAINGFDERETVRALAQSGLRYHVFTYCGFSRFGTYGSLACFLTKVIALASQVRRRLPYMAMLEDDMRIKPNFPTFIEQRVARHFGDGDSSVSPELLVLGSWGEAYVTSLAGARRVLQSLRHQGIPMNVDIMLNEGHVGRVERVQGTPWRHRVAPNFGDIQSTPHVRRELLMREGLALPPGQHCASAQCQSWVREARARYCRGRPSQPT